MSGLETAIRNALDRSERGNAEVRSRIYQSARQALEAGLQKQGVSDEQVVVTQRQRLEAKIREIEFEERRASQLASQQSAPPPVPPPIIIPDPAQQMQPPSRNAEAAPIPVASPVNEPPRQTLQRDEFAVGGETRDEAPASANGTPAGNLDGLFVARDTRGNSAAPDEKSAKQVRKQGSSKSKRRGTTAEVGIPERAAKPRKRRSFLSGLITWVVTLAVVGGGCAWVYYSEPVQTFIEQARNGNLSGTSATPGQSSFDPRRGFSEDWVAVFKPADMAQMQNGAQARVETVSASEGPAVRILSAVPGPGGDVAIEVPADVLREMAGKSSTIALTLQSGLDRSVQVSVRCDFASLGDCARHRFTATQEKLEALFQVDFDRALAPNGPGRIILNSGLDGADRPLLLYAVRILPGQ